MKEKSQRREFNHRLAHNERRMPKNIFLSQTFMKENNKIRLQISEEEKQIMLQDFIEV